MCVKIIPAGGRGGGGVEAASYAPAIRDKKLKLHIPEVFRPL